MEDQQTYILIAIIALALLFLTLILLRKTATIGPITPLTGLAFVIIVTGLLLNENRFVGYGLIGLGIIIAIVDMFQKLKKEKNA